MADTQVGGEMLARWSVVAGLSQSQLADRAGLDHSTVNRIVTGKRWPTRDTVLTLCAALDVTDSQRNRLLIAFGYTPFSKPLDDVTAGRVFDLAVRINNAGLTSEQRAVMRVAIDALELFADEFAVIDFENLRCV
jgi:transcriptional regulator with XRE-family HTH domain